MRNVLLVISTRHPHFYRFIFKQVVSTCQQNVSGNRKAITNTNIGQTSLLENNDPDSRALENLGFVYKWSKKGLGWVGWWGSRISKITTNAARAIEASVTRCTDQNIT